MKKMMNIVFTIIEHITEKPLIEAWVMKRKILELKHINHH